MRFMAPALLATLAALPMLAAAADAMANPLADEYCQPQPEQRVRNRDGSHLGVATTCPLPGTRRHRLTLYCADGQRCDRLHVDQPSEQASTGHVALLDLEGDGMHEAEVRGMCGAGPNCEGDVYRIDPHRRKLLHFFSGGYAELSVREGWLVEAGRASCCAWEFHAWDLSRPHELPLRYDNMDLMVRVGAHGDGDGGVEAADCTFLRPSGDNWRVVAPPSQALEGICEHYGEPYTLTPPDTAPDDP